MYVKLDRGFVLQHDDAGWLSTRQRIATTDYESIRKFISRAWPLVLYANIGCYVESDKWEYTEGGWQYYIFRTLALEWKSTHRSLA
ncbi:hypothetical protein LOK49_Contig200G00006 [Camellia lanceoleosa]|nr:hypothetical protein LOK49_Contig200G00006 [Camellia lanceoleosa]